MKTPNKLRRCAAGNALVITMIMTSVILFALASIVAWSSGTARLTARSNQYARSVAAAEAATEKVVTQLRQDFGSGGEALVNTNLDYYRKITPTSADSSYWAGWQFQDPQGNAGRTFVNDLGVGNVTITTGPYAGLYGFLSTYDIVSDASELAALQQVAAGVFREVQLTRIPIFQFGMYSSDDMEISCGQPFLIDGPVHSNGSLYVEPDNVMSFAMTVSAVKAILFQREPLDTRGPPSGSVVYLKGAVSNAPSLNLPIGATNSPQAVQQIIMPPPLGEDPASTIGRLRYYNQSDMIINISAKAVTASSGRFNSFGTIIPTNELALFVKTNNSFSDARESKTVWPLDINVGMLTTWSATNQNLRVALGQRDVSSIYVNDTRSGSAATLPAVRVSNGLLLPSLGLTVATSQPIYVWGNYNQANAANLNTTNTTTTKPASLVGDAVTILSPAWTDANSGNAVASRVATSNTVNAAILAGSVYTTLGHYSGGMENFQRFLENWSTATYTYNGSLVKMFASANATNVWGKANVYNPPTRAYYFDFNFKDAAKLPPLTPGLETINLSRWATVAANQTNAISTPW
jgi:hypothetical protein